MHEGAAAPSYLIRRTGFAGSRSGPSGRFLYHFPAVTEGDRKMMQLGKMKISFFRRVLTLSTPRSNTCGVATWGGEGLRVVRYMLVCRGGALGAVWCVDRCVVCRSLSSAGSRLCSHARAYTREQIPHMRPLPPKKIFLPPFRGARFLAERPFSARHRKPCYDFCVGRPGRQAQRPTGKSKHRGERICRTRA